MQTLKKAIPAALVLAFAGAAQAQVSVYGLIDMSYGKNEFMGDEKATIHSGGDEGNSQGNSTTRFGIKGSSDVGGGMKMNFNLQSGGLNSEGNVNGTLFNRQMWLGLSGGFGEVRVGRQDSVPFQAMGDFDFNGMSNGVSAGTYTGLGVWNTGRQTRSVQYMAPAMGGLKVHVGFVPKDGDNFTADATPDNSATEKATASAAAVYSAGPLAIGAAFEGKREEGGDDFMSVAASYDLKAVKFMVGYADKGDNQKGPSFGVTAPVAGFTVGAHYAKNTEADKASVLELFVNKEVFKNTYGYAEFGRGDATGVDAMTSYSVGVIYVF